MLCTVAETVACPTELYVFTNSLSCFVHFQLLRPPLWIPVTPVITADGCDDWGDENDGVRPKAGATGVPRTKNSSLFLSLPMVCPERRIQEDCLEISGSQPGPGNPRGTWSRKPVATRIGAYLPLGSPHRLSAPGCHHLLPEHGQ